MAAVDMSLPTPDVTPPATTIYLVIGDKKSEINRVIFDARKIKIRLIF